MYSYIAILFFPFSICKKSTLAFRVIHNNDNVDDNVPYLIHQLIRLYINDNSEPKSPTCLSPFSINFMLQSLVSESASESLYSEMNSMKMYKWRVWKFKNERQKFNFLSPYTVKVTKANPENCLMLTGLKLKTLVLMIDWLSKGEKDDGRVSREYLDDQIILTTVKLKYNPILEMLAHLCRIIKTTAIDYL